MAHEPKLISETFHPVRPNVRYSIFHPDPFFVIEIMPQDRKAQDAVWF
jgi:hypothetical protein